MFDQFAVANAIMDSAAAYDPYIYWRALEYDNYISNNGGLNIEDNLTWSGSLFTWNNSTDGNGRLMRLGVDYIEITPSQDFSVVLIPVNTSAELDIVIIKQNTSTELLDVVYSTQVGNNFVVNVTNTGDYDRFIAVVERFDFAVEDTTSEEYTLAFGSPTGISETSNPGFSVYPNPAKENVNVVFPTNNCKSITITDLLGNVIMSSEANSAMGKMSIDTREITSGMYFLTVCDTDNKVSTQKINIIH
jgi:hypothetical protein